MPRSPRAAARRRVLKDLAEAKQAISLLQTWWTVRSDAYDTPTGDWAANAARRDRRPEEYPEAQAHYWASTVAQLDDLTEHLGQLRNAALAEYHNTPKGQS